MRHVLGQDRAIEILQSALRGGRVHHAWIFHGPTGVGKRTTAEAFAATLLDPDAQADLSGAIEADPEGATARRIAAGTHPDLHLVTKELASYSSDGDVRRRKQITIPVQVIREFLVDPAHLSAHERAEARARKVFIVDESELMAREAQNVLLKTLEEPPSGTVIILVTANADRLLPTIHSRCQRVAFTPLSPDAMAQWIDRRATEESMSEGHRRWLERFAQGSPGLAELALENNLYEWFVTLDPMLRELRAGRYPATMGGVMNKLIDSFAKAWVKSRENASKDAANKAGARYLFVLLSEEVRDWIRADLEAGEPVDDHLVALDRIHDAERQLYSNVNLGLLLDELVAQWAEAEPVGDSWFNLK
ncbi:MAG: ATP-binding protein [Phycisphaerales bacterium]